ncbi:hypothetical protein ACFYN0_23490 [Streptomyces sp. NPDC006704]|uniref:hypothetical protein n=1 Tax=Streptomyces sp. NPDC006704 TaxID=3364760 RepID=UPI003674F9AE
MARIDVSGPRAPRAPSDPHALKPAAQDAMRQLGYQAAVLWKRRAARSWWPPPRTAARSYEPPCRYGDGAALPPSSPGWTDELWDLYEAYETSRSKGRRLPEFPAGQVARFEAMWERSQLSDSAHKLLSNLRERVEGGGLADPVAAAGVAVRLVRSHVAPHDAVYLLCTLKAPHGERGLRDLVTDRSINE